MEVLDRSVDTTVYHERDARAFDNYLMREPEVIERLVERARGRVFVIKALCEADRLPFLMQRFAPATVLWVFRHYEDAVRSSLRSFGKVADNVSDLVEDPAAHGWMGRGMSTETHARLRALHHPGMNDASRVALFWYIRNRLLYDTGLAGDPRVRLVHYERLLAAPDDELARLFDFLGLAYRPAIGSDVRPQGRHGSEPLPIEPAVRDACDELHAALERMHPREASAA
ncbi:MAG: sulfotransferase family protein [Halofilum sp. (in: g-proteobacteria)]|nr:sulfotransferase family protein [Halofilum sp. (in: g-proteobacteria)]